MSDESFRTLYTLLAIVFAVVMLLVVYDAIALHYVFRVCNSVVMSAFDYMTHDGLCDECRKGDHNVPV